MLTVLRRAASQPVWTLCTGTLTSILFSIMSALGIQPPPATWQLHPVVDGRSVSLTFSDHPRSSHSATIAIDELVRLRDHGVNQAWLRIVKDRDPGRLSVDQLVSLRDHGVETLQDLRRKRGA